jgi:hypothetical protein
MLVLLPACLVLASAFILGCAGQPAQAADAVYDVKAILATPLNPKTTKKDVKDGIVTEEVFFHSEMDGEKSVDIFAFFSYPEGGKNLPAFVWNQGGLYQANTYWTVFGAKRGYAVLCIDFPLGGAGYRSTGAYNITSNISLDYTDPKGHPIYHGAVALLKAVSYLESRTDVVDKNRIGMAGSSWGGFYTTYMVGLDPRLKAGSAMFGCGALQLGCAWFGGKAKDAEQAKKWATTLDPAFRLPETKTPMNWCATTNDNFYWMPALMESHARAGGPKHLALLPNWDHALTPELDDQVFAFLDQHLQGKPALNTVTPISLEQKGGQTVATWSYDGPREVKSAELLLSPGDDGNWRNRAWTTLPATITGKTCSVALPASSIPVYVSGNITDKDSYRASTPLLRVAANAKGTVPAIDGCAEWGDFEQAQIDGYIALHGYGCPPRVAGGKTGAQAAVITGSVNLPPVRFIAGVSQRVTCYLKAEQPLEVTLKFAQKADGADYAAETKAAVGTEWTKVELDILPIAGMDTFATLSIAGPKDVKVLLDAVTLTAK